MPLTVLEQRFHVAEWIRFRSLQQVHAGIRDLEFDKIKHMED